MADYAYDSRIIYIRSLGTDLICAIEKKEAAIVYNVQQILIHVSRRL